MASGVGGLSADRPPCARPSGLRLRRALWVSALILRSFMVCEGEVELVGWPVHLWRVVEMFRDGGRVGWRQTSGPSWVFLVGKRTGEQRRDRAICTSKEYSRRAHANRQAGVQADMQPAEQAISPPVGLSCGLTCRKADKQFGGRSDWSAGGLFSMPTGKHANRQ